MMKLARLVLTSLNASATRSRKQKIELFSELLEALEGEDLEIGVAFLSGELRQGKVGLGWAMVRNARADASEATREPLLTLADVDRAFAEIGAMSGAGSKGRKLEHLRALFQRATKEEQDFLGNLIGGELRQGALEAVLLEGVAKASGLPADRVRRATMLGGALREVALAALTEGEAGLARFQLELMRPLQPMLAGTAADAAEVTDKLGRAAFEWKLDGARLQVHKQGDVVRAFTRRLHDVTHAVPEVVEALLALDDDELLLDGEVIAFAPDGRPQPFQTTMSRFGRKLDVAAQRKKTPLTPVFFDALVLGGKR